MPGALSDSPSCPEELFQQLIAAHPQLLGDIAQDVGQRANASWSAEEWSGGVRPVRQGG
jgi:monoamine oxidase